MRTPWRTLSWIVVLAGSALAFGDETASELAARFRPTAAQSIAAKQQRLLTVVAELRARDVRDWPAERLAARTRSLDLLERYARRAEFTFHRELWPRESPLFIDEAGTRCALASVLDGVGKQEVVLNLAASCNDAYLNEIDDDAAIARVVEELGLTLDEAAYIQGPGIDLGDGTRVVIFADTFGLSSELGDIAAPAAPETPTVPAPPPNVSTPSGRAPVTTGASGGPPSTPRGRGPSTPMARRSHDSVALSVAAWWAANYDRYLDPGAVARQGAPTTPITIDGKPTADDRAALARQFEAVADDDAQREVRATALAMWARVTEPGAPSEVLPSTLRFLADTNQPEREWGPVLLAILASPDSTAALAEMAGDTPAGRARFGTTAAIPDSMRAAMAIALGRAGGEVEPLAALVADRPSAHVEVASAAVVGLGLLARHPTREVAATTALMGLLRDDKLPATVVAQVPAALTLANATAALPQLFDVVERFRGPRELRAACAWSLGELSPDLDPAIADALLALATRDVDVAARQSAIVALGRLAERHGATAAPDVAAKVAAFLVDGLRGRTRKSEDLPWHAVAAGLAARGRIAGSGELVERLSAVAADDSKPGPRAAALLALGLANAQAAQPLLVEAADAGDALVASHAIYALGLLGDRSQRAPLLSKCGESSDGRVAFAAALVLGSFGDPTILGPLAATFASTRNDVTRGALAQAIGQLHDRRVLEVLSTIAFDATRGELLRERALAALGAAAQPEGATWNDPLRHAVHPGLATPTLRFFCGLF